jgi:hypothetical protein
MKSRLTLLVAITLSAALATTMGLAAQEQVSDTWYVDGVNGNDSNDCKSATTACKTIGHALSLASSGDSIMVAAATYTENLAISFSLNLIGSGAITTIIDGGHLSTVVTISASSARVILPKVTIRNGNGLGFGGGIDNLGRLTIDNSTISGNSVRPSGFIRANGGGIYNGATLTIDHSTISGNTSSNGGGIYNQATLTINNSTIDGNSAVGRIPFDGYGGGIFGSATINNSTISHNVADTAGSGIDGSATLQNSILANFNNCAATITSNGYNLSNDDTCNLDGPGDLNNTDPQLGPLQNNGGPTQTLALLSGSPAIDAGNPAGCTDNLGRVLKTDQRGQPRPDKEDSGGCDMGAYESQSD